MNATAKKPIRLKTKRILALCLALALALGGLIAGFYAITKKRAQSGEYYWRPLAAFKMSDTVAGERVRLKYSHSVIDQSATPSELADGYGAYDEYLAPNGDRYTYRTGTNMLTGYLPHHVAGSSSHTLTQDQAIQAMSAYLEQFLGADHPYVFSKVEQANYGSWYGIY
nr:hypothetical protein [bacterium]